MPRLWRDFSTAIGEAMALAVPYFAILDKCDRFVIDISGDGISNEAKRRARSGLIWLRRA